MKGLFYFIRNFNKVGETMDLYIDLTKGNLNTSKLVKRAVQVRGKNGKIFTRMQWVDPKTGLPPSKEKNINTEEEHNISATKKKVYDTSHQKGFIDHHIDKVMTRDEKYDHLHKHGVDWKHNDHPAIDHKNAMMALKEHLYNNPHLVGAEHLPKEPNPDIKPDGESKLTDFLNGYKKKQDLLYDMMRHLSIIDKDQVDPRTIAELGSIKEGGNGKGAIMHMKNMMALKKHLRENPGVLDDLLKHEKYGEPHSDNDKKNSASTVAPPKPKSQNVAQKGGNDIKGILKSMPREDIYKLMKENGIADSDPALDPSIDPKMRPIHHMRNMMALKKLIEQNPRVLSENLDTGELNEDEKNRIESLKGKDKVKHEVNEFLNRASKRLKSQWADDFSDHEIMKNRPTSEHENIDNMKKMEALKKILMEDPSIMEELEPELRDEELLNMKIGNKDMGKFLRQVAGLKGRSVGDVVAGFERGKQWEFGIDGTAEITTDDEGEPILSIVDAGPEGEDYNEMAFPLKKVKEFLDGLKEGKKVDVSEKEIPLHKKSPTEIWRELNKDFSANYTPAVGKVLKPEIGKLWDAQRTDNVNELVKNSIIHISGDTFRSLMKEYNVPMKGLGATIDTDSENWKEVVYGHKIEPTKSKNAMDYLEKDIKGQNDTWVLHKSAKQWSPEERSEARKDFIGKRLTIKGLDHLDDLDARKNKLVDLTHKSLEFVPFDLMTDIMANRGSINFHATNHNGGTQIGSYQNNLAGGMWFDPSYVTDSKLLHVSNPYDYTPDSPNFPKGHPNEGYKYTVQKLSDVVAHEFAHEIDGYLSGGDGYLKWGDTKQGSKYVEKNPNVVKDSYTKAVEKSNPNHLVAHNDSQDFYFHLDEFMSSYEGRIYGATTLTQNTITNEIRDRDFNPMPVEHWSENVSRMANAVHAFKNYQKETGDFTSSMDEWAKVAHSEYLDAGFGDDSNSDGNKLKSYLDKNMLGIKAFPDNTQGYLYHEMSKKHPELHESIKNILLRPDFIDDKSTDGVISSTEKGEYARKSMNLVIDL